MCQSAASQKYCSWGHFLPVRSQLNWGRPNRETPVYFKVNINWKTKGNKKKKQKVKNRRNCLSKRSDQDDMRGFTLAPCFLPPACAWVVRSQEYFKAKLSLLPPPSSPVKRKKNYFLFFFWFVSIEPSETMKHRFNKAWKGGRKTQQQALVRVCFSMRQIPELFKNPKRKKKKNRWDCGCLLVYCSAVITS